MRVCGHYVDKHATEEVGQGQKVIHLAIND